MVTGLEIGGSPVTGEMVWTPEPEMSKAIVSGPGFALASRIACRSDPAPESLVLVTVNVDADRPEAARTKSAAGTRFRFILRLDQNAAVSAWLAWVPDGLSYVFTAPVCVSLTVIRYCTSDRAP